MNTIRSPPVAADLNCPEMAGVSCLGVPAYSDVSAGINCGTQ